MASRNNQTAYPEPVERLIEEFTQLPGIGRRSAERMAFYVLKASEEEALGLSRAVADVKQKVRCCSVCYSLTDLDLCSICKSEERDASKVLVVEQARDLIRLEQTGVYKGVYHVLTGRIDPLGGVEPGDLTIASLFDRLEKPEHNCRGVKIQEVILGLNPDLEGDTTGLYLADELAKRGVGVTRLARGLPAGSHLEFASKAVLADAIEGRQAMNSESD